MASKDNNSERSNENGLLGNELNRGIIQALRIDGRTAFSEIAQKLDVSEGTIRNRVNAMKSAGVLHIAAITDESAEEYRTEAMLGINISSGHDPAVTAARLSEIDDIVYVTWVSGRYDLLIEIVSNNETTLLHLLSTHIHNQQDIASVEVMTGLKNFKNQFLLKSNWR
jgi:Lrp/AsnC family transcriptional regulator for asnA, asnC and gidA